MRWMRASLVTLSLIVMGAVLSAQLPGPPVGAPQANQNLSYGYNFEYTFRPSSTTGGGFRVLPTLALTTSTGNTSDLVRMGGTVTLPNSSTTVTTAAVLHLLVPTYTLNSGTLTTATTLLIDGDPATGSTKIGFWNKGTTRLDGALSSSTGGWTFAGGTVTTSNPFAITQTWNAGGVAFVGQSWTFTETADAAGSNYLAVLGGAAGTTAEWSVGKGGTTSQLAAATISATTNQLVLGTTNTTTVNAPAPAAGIVLTLPNAATGSLPVGVECGASLAAGGTCANTAMAGTFKINFGTFLLSTNASTVTFATGLGYTSTTSYNCVANDITTRANPVQAVPASATTVTITNTTGASDLISMICTGF